MVQEGKGKRDHSDLTGQRFGRLTVTGRGDRDKSNYWLWKCVCDCGGSTDRNRRALRRSAVPSCGCFNRERFGAISTARTKPDITGQRFGRLVVLGKAGRKNDRQLWSALCDCGNVIERERSVFDYGKQVSCGCLTYANGKRKRQPRDITGQRFGQLTAIRLSGRQIYNSPAWLLQCDCGGSIEMPLKILTKGYRLHCGLEHHVWGGWYPEMPNPMPAETKRLTLKYWHLLEVPYDRIDTEIQDERRDRLIRCCWILTYRRSLGENISETHEERYLSKSVSLVAASVRQQRHIKRNGGFLVRSDGRILKAKIGGQRLIGNEMADATFLDYPVSESETPEISILPIIKQSKRIRFKRR